MKVIIVVVTLAANSFGQAHLGQIREAYELIGEIVAKAQAEGVFRVEIDAQFAAMAFYGAIEQMLTGWIFGCCPRARSTSSGPSGWSSKRSAEASRRAPSARLGSDRSLARSVAGRALDGLKLRSSVKATPTGNRLH